MSCMQYCEVLVLPWLSCGAEKNFSGLRRKVKISPSPEIKSLYFCSSNQQCSHYSEIPNS